MDTELIRTFLEVNRTRHFSRAAEHLFVTPAAVSARVRLLEEQLGSRLFVRSRNNIRLTAAGQRFLPHAENMLRSWNRAKLSVGTSPPDLELLTLGSLHSIWSVLLPGWLAQAYDVLSGLVLQVELLGTQAVVSGVREQSLDLGLLYEPPRVTDLAMEAVATVQLVLVADRPGLRADESLTDYVLVDWGVPFAMTVARTLPDLPDPALRVDSPELAYEFLASRGGAAYLPWPLVRQDLDAGRLHRVRAAPVIERPVYLIRRVDTEPTPAHALVQDNLLSWLAARARPEATAAPD
ncbi:MAG TPA: LysR family transcriptional regulator [Pseudomonadales bacterium]